MQFLASLVFIGVLVFQPFFQGDVFADTVDPEVSPAPVVENPSPVQRVTEPDPLVDLQANYFKLLEKYRQQEQKYIVAKGQFLQLNTLAAQEDAVRETRLLVDIRADIFIMYLDMMMMYLDRTTGIPIENKSPQAITLGLLKEKVQRHKTKNLESSDRIAIDLESDEFEILFQELQSESYYTLGLIRIGRVQTAIDKLKYVRQVVFDKVMSQEMPTHIKSEKERGFDEIDRTLEQIDQNFTPIKNQTLTKTNNSLNTDTQLSRNLTDTFAKMNQTVQFLEEIRQ